MSRPLLVLDGDRLFENGVDTGPLVLTEGQKSKPMVIVERFSGSWVNFHEVPVTETEQQLSEAASRGRGVLCALEGRFQMADTGNANKRVYPNAIWERVFESNSTILERMTAGEMLSELDHPQDGETRLQRVVGRVSKIWRNESNAKEILGRMVIFATESGRQVKAIIDGGGRVGVSSRGQGSVVRMEGLDVVQSDFILETWDVVHNPSTPGAYPSVFPEATKVNSMSHPKITEAQNRFARLRAHASAKLSDDARGLLIAEVTDLRQSLTEASWGPAESPKAVSLAMDVGDFLRDLKEERVLTEARVQTEAKDDDAETDDDAESADDKNKDADDKKDDKEPRPTEADAVEEVLQRLYRVPVGSGLAEAISGARLAYRKYFRIEGPLTKAETAGIAQMVQRSPRVVTASEGKIRGRIRFSKRIDEATLPALVKKHRVNSSGVVVEFTDPALMTRIEKSVFDIPGVSASITWDERDRVVAECVAKYAPLLEAQTVRVLSEAKGTADSKAQLTELSVKLQAAKQLITTLANRTKIAESRLASQGTLLESAYLLIDALTNECREERMTGVVEGICSMNPNVDSLPGVLAKARNLTEAVAMTRKTVTTTHTKLPSLEPTTHAELLDLNEAAAKQREASRVESSNSKASPQMNPLAQGVMQGMRSVGGK